MIFNFNEPYNRENWIDLLRTKLLPNDFQTKIENVKGSINCKLDRFDKVTFLGESKSLNLAVYEITHKSESDPRVSLSKIAFRMLANFSKRRALIFFVPENNVDYRLSLITIDLELKGKKIQKLYSNPRRYSFLLGAEAKLGTIHDKLLNSKAIEHIKRVDDFSDLKERFSVESVSKQFFKEYKELHEKIKKTFNGIPNFNIVAAKHIDSNFIELFSRKLLGQIVFIYFLQRKKWLGGNPSNKKWDDGKKDFLRWAFKYCEQNDLNFFDSFLEKLFYSGFNEKEDSFEFNKIFIKVPFLNGGLFEKFYKSNETLILHPSNSLFSNNDETGILDIFDKYNFTIDENTFFEQEVAVDPEMLGKVFENLLPENLRKGKGTYYTPREIVSYMTRESLINFLKTKLETKNNDNRLDEKIRRLFDYKDFYISKKESEEYGKEFEKQFYEMLDIVEEVNKYLTEIKIVDPAVGSGAFPMGILLEIVSLREYIEREFLNNNKISSYELKKETIQNSIYGVDIDPGAVEIAKLRFWLSLVVDAEKPEPLPNLDYKIMQGNSLIESFAGIDIGKNKEYKQKAIIDQISNVQAELNKVNAEITKKQAEVLEAYRVKNPLAKKMMEDMNLQHKEKKKIEKKLNKLNQEIEVEEYDRTEVEIINKIHDKQNELYTETDKRKKEELREEIENLIVELFDEKLNFIKEKQATILKLIDKKLVGIINLEERKRIEQNERKKYKVLKFDIQKAEHELHKYTKKDKIRPFFPWHLYFADVFKENGGFDIVIGNPPYLRVQGIDKELSKEYKIIFKSSIGSYDLYVLFVEKGLSLLSKKGILNYIIPHKWMNSNFGKGLREFSKDNIFRFISFGAYQVFNASTYTSLVWFKNFKNTILCYTILDRDLNTNQELENYLSYLNNDLSFNIKNSCLTSNSWILTDKKTYKILEKLKLQPLRVYDVFEKIFQGIATSKDSVYFLFDCIDFGSTIKGFSKELNKFIIIERELVKPLLKGDDVHRYEKLITNKYVIFPYKFLIEKNKEKSVIYTENEIKVQFPFGYKYLIECKDVLQNRENGRLRNDNFWYKYIYPKNQLYFKQPKLIAPDISLGGNFAIDFEGRFYSTTTLYGYLKKKSSKDSYQYLAAIMNSKLLWWFLINTGTTLANGYFRFKPDYLETFPISKISDEHQQYFIKLVDQILIDKKASKDTQILEDKIDLMVYKLYELSYEEVKIVDPEVDKVLASVVLNKKDFEQMNVDELSKT